MAEYDVDDLIGARAGLGNLHTHLEAMRARFDLNDATNLQSTASSGLTTLATTTLSDVETTEIIVAVWQCSWSTNTAGSGLIAQLDIGGDTSESYLYAPSGTTSSAGDLESVCIMHVATGLSGSVDVDFNWARRNGVGTVYMDSRALICFRLRNGAAA